MSSTLALVDHLARVAALLFGAGFHQVPAWWFATLARFWRSGRRVLVLRVGRRGGKSSTLCLVAVLEALFGGHQVPAGDVGVVAIVSVSRDEASGRLRTIEWMLRALRVPFERRGDVIELVGRAVVFKTFSASIAGVSGFTAICILCDELSKWRDADTGANPAREVMATLRPTMATVKSARMYVSSSAFSTLDYHYELFEQGDTPNQLTAYAPSWEANPSITEAETHGLEPDERIWRREYAGVPQSGSANVFAPEAIERAFARSRTSTGSAEKVMIIDASSGRKDAWTWGIASWCAPQAVADELLSPFGTAVGRVTRDRVMRTEMRPGPAGHLVPFTFWEDAWVLHRPDGSTEPYTPPRAPSFLAFHVVDGLGGNFYDQVDADTLVARLASVGRQWGARKVHADQRESYSLRSSFKRHGLEYVEHPWTSSSKPDAVDRVRRWFQGGVVALPPHAKLRRELLNFEERITPSGSLTFGARGSGHDDYVALLITAAMADIERQLPGSPLHLPNYRYELAGRQPGAFTGG